MPETNITAGEFRRAMGQFCTGVAVVTILDPAGAPQGMTINSLTSLSVSPPSLLWCLGEEAAGFQAFAAAKKFAVNILGEGQEALSNHFAGLTPPSWEEVSWRPGPLGLPLLEGAKVQMECRVETRHSLFDHVVIVGRAANSECDDKALPLLYYRCAYDCLRK